MPKTNSVMYLEIHPFWYNSAQDFSDLRSGVQRPRADYYKPCDTQLLRLDIIRRIVAEHVADGSAALRGLVISDDHTDDIIVSEKEAEAIKKALMKGDDAGLSRNIEYLTTAIRDLWQLLRARMR